MMQRFRWVICMLKMLKKCLKRSKLRKTLATLPKTLDQTYERILSEIDEDFAEDASRVLQWLYYSERPITLDAMVDVLATDLKNDHSFNPEERLSDPQQVVIICSSLVHVTEEHTLHGKLEKYLQLAHFSVKEYLTSGRIQTTSFLPHLVDNLSASIAITKTCLAYLNSFPGSATLDKEFSLKFPFYEYAAEHWTVYYDLMDTETKIRVNGLIIKFLESKNDDFGTGLSSDHLILV